MTSQFNKHRPILWFLIAWIFLNTLINLNYPGETNVGALVTISPEVWVLLVILCVAVWLGMPFHYAIYAPLTVFVIFLRLFRIGDVLMPMYFYRSFNLYMDVQYLPDLLHLLYNTVSLPVLIGYTLLGVGFFALAVWGIWQALKSIHSYFTVQSQRFIFLGVSILLAGIWLDVYPDNFVNSHAVFAKEFAPRVVEEVEFILNVKGYREKGQHIIREAEIHSGHLLGDLDKLAGTNVYLFFIESYGHTAFADSRHFPFIKPVLEQFEQTLFNHGFGVYSHFMTAATYGGASWLSHGTIATGVRTYDQTQFNLVLNSQIKPLAAYFNDTGYRTISVMPNTTMPWPEGKFFDFQKEYYARDFHYQGPQYGWATMPDQFVIDYIFRQEIQHQTQPLFIEYVLVSSHAPFHQQPPYLEDWSQIGDGAIYQEKPSVTFPVVWTDLRNASEAYVTAIIYDLRVLEAYLAQYIRDDALIILLGDHQPNVQLTGEDSLWSVPIHVISRNPALLEPFIQRGYTPGLIPNQPLPHPGMETFLWSFLEDFSWD